MTTTSFSASVGAWAQKVEGAVEAVFKQSVQELVREVQKTRNEGGRMRVDTGFLRASLLASTSMMPRINPAAKPAKDAGPNSVPYNFGTIEAVIAGSELGQTIYLGYTASYAGYREYGVNDQPGDAFVRTAAQRWSSIVEAEAAKAKARFGL
ncbi:hypothetical protein [Aureimonas sp. N4]|uniref:hypothetical protein n=1 Tax=Aureimonas sp. N4 TaxID=1638165 RepID=UPI0007807734|nr:hypothetical protein [Aureimonas sp. N4]